MMSASREKGRPPRAPRTGTKNGGAAQSLRPAKITNYFEQTPHSGSSPAKNKSAAKQTRASLAKGGTTEFHSSNDCSTNLSDNASSSQMLVLTDNSDGPLKYDCDEKATRQLRNKKSLPETNLKTGEPGEHSDLLALSSSSVEDCKISLESNETCKEIVPKHLAVLALTKEQKLLNPARDLSDDQPESYESTFVPAVTNKSKSKRANNHQDVKASSDTGDSVSDTVVAVNNVPRDSILEVTKCAKELGAISVEQTEIKALQKDNGDNSTTRQAGDSQKIEERNQKTDEISTTVRLVNVEVRPPLRSCLKVKSCTVEMETELQRKEPNIVDVGVHANDNNVTAVQTNTVLSSATETKVIESSFVRQSMGKSISAMPRYNVAQAGITPPARIANKRFSFPSTSDKFLRVAKSKSNSSFPVPGLDKETTANSSATKNSKDIPHVQRGAKLIDSGPFDTAVSGRKNQKDLIADKASLSLESASTVSSFYSQGDKDLEQERLLSVDRSRKKFKGEVSSAGLVTPPVAGSVVEGELFSQALNSNNSMGRSTLKRPLERRSSDRDLFDSDSDTERSSETGSEGFSQARSAEDFHEEEEGESHSQHSFSTRHRIAKSHSSMNKEFYLNKRRSEPDGDLIENILKTWKGKYDKLEAHHGYIQWLFPTDETTMFNSHSQVLQPHEAQYISNDPNCQRRFRRAFQLMLDFYGMRLTKKNHQRVIIPADNYKSRFDNLNRMSHNNLRITRMLKCLGLMGQKCLQAPFVSCLIDAAFKDKMLKNCQRSCIDYWIPAVSDATERRLFEKNEYILAAKKDRGRFFSWR